MPGNERCARPLGARAAPLLAIALGTAGCTVDATGLLVTLKTRGTTVDHISVTVFRGTASLGGGGYDGVIGDGATFGVALPDSLDGTTVTVQVDGSRGNVVLCSGNATTAIALRKAVPVTVTLDCPLLGGDDMAVDAGLPDLTPSPDLYGVALDLARDDLAPPDLCCGPPDLAMPDLVVVPDLTPPCVPSCTNGVATICPAGKATPFACSFGCSGAQCAGPSGCGNAADITRPQSYNGCSIGAKATTQGSCAMAPGPDNSFKFSTAAWSNVTLTLSADFAASLFTRLNCGDPMTEVAAGGRCAMPMSPAIPACQQGGMITQTLCGLPPNMPYFTTVASPNGAGGNYTITTSVSAPLTLNDCDNAGMLPGANFSVNGDTTGKKNNMRAPQGTMGCGDFGATSPEQVFWVPVTTPNKNLSFTVMGKGGFQPLVYVQPGCQQVANQTLCYPANNGMVSGGINLVPTGSWFIVVDGQGGKAGQFTLTMTLK
jgi:hypothetical protein